MSSPWPGEIVYRIAYHAAARDGGSAGSPPSMKASNPARSAGSVSHPDALQISTFETSFALALPAGAPATAIARSRTAERRMGCAPRRLDCRKQYTVRPAEVPTPTVTGVPAIDRATLTNSPRSARPQNGARVTPRMHERDGLRSRDRTLAARPEQARI